MMKAEVFYQLAEKLPYGLYIVSPDRTILFWNDEAERITGYTREEMVGRKCATTNLHHLDEKGTPLCQTYCPLLQCMDEGKAKTKKLIFTHKNGFRVVISAHFIPLTDDQGRITMVAEAFEELSLLDRDTSLVQNLYSLAYHDSLTHLPNRVLLEATLRMRFSEFHRLHESFAVLFADIDHFHKFNEQYGHLAGDSMLKVIAESMKQSSRKTDTIGRWGGEEFLGIFLIKDKKDTMVIANRLQKMINQTFIPYGDEKLHVTMSIGITAVQEEDTMPSIISRADHYMYRAKNMGRNTIITDEQ
ncbi:MAG: sensor domain-containing diguanylate cyclase [Allisonella histaminiformans]|uniref:sensor domain-containing diguanylate cyclase n=1 Tax=Allisonella histaminiformans TaxID=209880 RepID=UPI002A82F58D|nr:sensor domain-containing diguanylate cyclase [Allisonella histaminiformans]MDY3956722.1 sensor domain-containing diguanylate cyclase [Allisonella histaminiformans]